MEISQRDGVKIVKCILEVVDREFEAEQVLWRNWKKTEHRGAVLDVAGGTSLFPHTMSLDIQILARLSKSAFTVTLMELSVIVIAATSGGRTTPIGTRMPAATGIATTL
jgi:hypothetical protein